MKTRREFLSGVVGSSALLSLSGIAPGVFCEAAEAGRKEPQGRILVVVQLSGGNDGLNTIVPVRHDTYRKNREKLRLDRDDVLRIDDDYGFHPEMKGLAGLLESSMLGIVPGVGYPNPNQSHFESMDIWHTCRRKTEKREHGWLGQMLERAKVSNGLAGMHIGGGKQPLALAARNLRIPSVESLERFRLNKSGNARLDRVLAETIAEAGSQRTNNDLLGFVKSSTQSAVAANDRLQKVGSPRDLKGFPQSPLGQKLATIAKLIKAELPTRVYYVTLDGFDTHARQSNAHSALLRQFSDAVTALVRDLETSGHADRVLVLSFSEFGRRVKENASEGTDHGTAGPLFLAGKPVRSGFLAPHPNLSDLKNGDLKFRTDFRSVYAGIIQNWFGVKDTSAILGKAYKPLSFLRTSVRSA